MTPIFSPEFQQDLIYWAAIDPAIAQRILNLVQATLRDPAAGPGRPQLLKFLGPGVWSRRITQEHRLVYVVGQDHINFLQARYHYGD